MKIFLFLLTAIITFNAQANYSRIIALDKAAFDILVFLEQTDKIIAVNRYIKHDLEQVKSIDVFQINLEEILNLEPDLILATEVLAHPDTIQFLTKNSLNAINTKNIKSPTVHHYEDNFIQVFADELLKINWLLKTNFNEKITQKLATIEQQITLAQQKFKEINSNFIFGIIDYDSIFIAGNTTFEIRIFQTLNLNLLNSAINGNKYLPFNIEKIVDSDAYFITTQKINNKNLNNFFKHIIYIDIDYITSPFFNLDKIYESLYEQILNSTYNNN